MRRLALLAAILAVSGSAQAQSYLCGKPGTSNNLPARYQRFVTNITCAAGTCTVTVSDSDAAWLTNDFLIHLGTGLAVDGVRVQITVTNNTTYTFSSVVSGSAVVGQGVWAPTANPNDTYTDPLGVGSTGGCVTKQVSASVSPNSDFGHLYIVPMFNSDSTRVLLGHLTAGTVEITDLNGTVTNSEATIAANAPGYYGPNTVWSTADPHIFYYYKGSDKQIRKYDVSTDTASTVGLPLTVANGRPVECTLNPSGGFGGAENPMSLDGDTLALYCTTATDHCLATYQIAADKMSTNCISITLSGNHYDTHKLTGNGLPVVVWGNTFATQCDPTSTTPQYAGVEVWDKNFVNYLGCIAKQDGHLDAGFDQLNGTVDAVVVTTVAMNNSFSGNCNPGLVLAKIVPAATPKVTLACLLSWASTNYYGDVHIVMSASKSQGVTYISTDRPGAGSGANDRGNFPASLATTWATGWLYPMKMVQAVNLLNGNVQQFAFTYARDANNGAGCCYYSQVGVSSGVKGDYIGWNTNFGLHQSDTSYNQAFTVKVFGAAPAAPTLASLSPNNGAQSTTPSVTLTGTGFDAVGTNTINFGGTGITAPANVANNSTTLVATFTIAAGAALGSQTVSVTNVNGTSGTQNFTTTLGTPTLSAISPTSGTQGATVAMTLTGTNFSAPMTLNLSGVGVSYSNLVVVNSTSITANFVILPTAPLATITVSATNGTGTSGNQNFTVNPPVAPCSMSGSTLMAGNVKCQ